MIRLKELRMKNHVSLAKLANVIGVKASTISYYENSKRNPSIEHLILISDYFGVTIDFLCGREEIELIECEKITNIINKHPVIYDFIKTDTRISILKLEEFILEENKRKEL